MTSPTEIEYSNPGRGKFLVGGLLILAAVIYLIVSSTLATAQSFLTIEEMLARGDSLVGKPITVTGAVVGESIDWDAEQITLRFTVVQIPADNKILNAEGGLAAVLRAAVRDPSRPRIEVVYYGPRPDLLQHEAQAIIIGKLNEDGVFYAEELLLKCPTRYEEALPDSVDA